MKVPIRPGKFYLLAAFLALIFLSKVASGQSFVTSVKVPAADPGTQAGPTLTIAGPVIAANDLVIVYTEYRGTVIPTVSGGGQTWNLATTYAPGATNQAISVYWCTFNGSWVGNTSVTVGAGNTNALSAFMTIFAPAVSTDVWGLNVVGTNANSLGTTQTINAVTTTVPNAVAMAYWSAGTNITYSALSAGWTKPWGATAQVRNSTTESHSSAYKIIGVAGSTGAPQQSESSSSTTLRSMLAWNELSNDECSGAITLTPGATCTSTGGNVVGSSLSTGVPLPSCGTPTYDVWYKFTAAATIQSVTLSGLGTNFTNSGIQILQGSCGSLTTVACASGTSVNGIGLTIGNVYYVRVYSTDPLPITLGTFSICVVNAPANDDCTTAIPVTSSTTCNNTAGTLVNATYATIPSPCGASSGVRNDVWYSFVALSTNPSIKLTSGPSDISVQIYSGTCGALSSIQCTTTVTTTATLTVTAVNSLTLGNTYYIRVFSNNNTANTFNMCVQDNAPSNDACSGATTITASTSCVNTTGTFYATTNEAPTITGDCAGIITSDIWYKFVAQSPNPTITLSSLGAGISNPGIEVLSGGCGSQSAVVCGTNSVTANFLTPGGTYYIRLYNTGTAPTSGINGLFNVCIQDPVAAAPFNDDCANAINVPIWNTCNKVLGTMTGATLSSVVSFPAPCTGTVAYDVWYKFTSVNTTATVSLSGLGTNFTASGLQVFSGTCGSLTSVACANGTTVTASGLTAGSVYYVRVFSTTGPAPNGNASFSICATTTNAPVRFGNSYVNLSKKTTGGVIQKGDTLELRFTVNHTSGTMSSLRFVDDVPTNASMLATTNDSIRIITNEGLTYKKYTVASGDDAGSYKPSPLAVGEYNVRVNLGFSSGSAPAKPTVMTNAATSANGQMSSSDKPKGGGGLLFAIAYRVVVTGNTGDSITLFPGQFIYNDGTSDITLTATPFKILISDPLNLCANSFGLNNAVENGGTFGSGTPLTRSTDLTTPIAGYTFVPDASAYANSSGSISSVGDGRYSIVKNVSPKSSSFGNAARVPTCPSVAFNDPLSCTNRMFGGHWDVTGDHSGTNTSTGNTPPDINTASGYMLEVNADYVASEVYRQTIHNLCPNTYYEFSAWVKNICHTCGADSTGAQFAGTSTAPALGYPGVLPNLTFTLDNLDYYNTGEIDTLGWLKKGFVFKTDTSTTATFSIRNNAQGGGGNDWALDDIAIATCLPTMTYSPTINPAVCAGNSLIVNDTVSSYFNNYTFYKWQRSTDAGGTWSDITSTSSATLHNTGSIYQFITSDTIPPAHTTPADSADLYRVIVATDNQNLLTANCLFTDASTIITLKVLNCGPVLSIDLLSFSGKLNGGYADLNWVTSKENEPVTFRIQKSLDGTNFTDMGSIEGHGNPNDDNFYQFRDPTIITGRVWYRLALYSQGAFKKYSRIIPLNDQSSEFSLNSVVNPFNTELDFEISTPDNSRVDAIITSLSGKPVRKESFNVYAGTNSLTILNTENLPAGMYILQIRNKDSVVNKKIVKK